MKRGQRPEYRDRQAIFRLNCAEREEQKKYKRCKETVRKTQRVKTGRRIHRKSEKQKERKRETDMREKEARMKKNEEKRKRGKRKKERKRERRMRLERKKREMTI